MSDRIRVLPVREQSDVILRILRRRLETILPVAMREAGLDLWLILCQEDDHDPVFRTMIPMNTWTPILQMLVFHDRGVDEGVERINLSMTNTAGLYETPWKGTDSAEQWRSLERIVAERDPKRIGVNIGSVNWASGGLTHNLYLQLTRALPEKYADRIVSAETACTRWLMTLSEEELELYPYIVSIAHSIIADCFSRETVIPGVTTTEDLEWAYWQRCADLGFEQAFKPHFRIVRDREAKVRYPIGDRVIRRGDVLHCDVGFRYLRLNTDHQELAYVRRDGEEDAPPGLKRLLAENNRLQRIYMEEFRRGLTGNQMLENMLSRARDEGVPSPKVYSHSLGLYLHEPGPLIGLPWEQNRCSGRGDVKLEYDTCFTMELSVGDAVPEWDDGIVHLWTEQDVSFTRDGCRPMDGIQTSFHLI